MKKILNTISNWGKRVINWFKGMSGIERVSFGIKVLIPVSFFILANIDRTTATNQLAMNAIAGVMFIVTLFMYVLDYLVMGRTVKQGLQFTKDAIDSLVSNATIVNGASKSVKGSKGKVAYVGPKSSTPINIDLANIASNPKTTIF